MEYWGLSIDDVKYCLLTHPHYDHAGGAHFLKKRGIKLIAIQKTAEAILKGDERCCGYFIIRHSNPSQLIGSFLMEKNWIFWGFRFRSGTFLDIAWAAPPFCLTMSKSVWLLAVTL